jgi:hypothetical protein
MAVSASDTPSDRALSLARSVFLVEPSLVSGPLSEANGTPYGAFRPSRDCYHCWQCSAVEPKSLYASRRPGTHLAAFSSVDIRPGIPPSSALRVDAARRLATAGTHLNDAKRKGTWVPRH